MSGITPGKTYSPMTTTAGRKDAFHVACILCRKSSQSKYNLDPGDRVRVDGDAAAWADPDDDPWDGVVDPFVEKIGRNDLFWVFLRPERVKELTHSFVFVPAEDPKSESEQRVSSADEWDSGCRKCDS